MKTNLPNQTQINKAVFKFTLKLCLIGLMNLPIAAYGSNFFQRNSLPENDAPQKLTPNVEIEREIKGSETHFYEVEVKENDCIHLTIQQKGIDVIINVRNPAGKSISQVDRPNGSVGRETVTFIAEENVAYIVEITGYNPNLLPNKYSILLAEASPPNEADRMRIFAERLTTEAELLRNKGAEDYNRQAVEKFLQAFSIWEKLNDSYEQAVVYYGLGWSYIQLNKYGEATLNFARALKIVQTSGDEFAQTINYAGIGWAEFYIKQIME